jgi:hypothetical protein
MAKRFSGDVRLTISGGHAGLIDEYDVRVKAPGCSPHEGIAALMDGYTDLHGVDAAIDQAARQYLSFLEGEQEFAHLVKPAAKDGDVFHVGRGKADRWPGGLSNTKTKKGRDFAS